MAEMIKEIKTRVALRTGDYAYWTTGAGKDIVLYKGEVCICTVAVADNQATTAPTVLFKVADANGKKFADLNWTSGLAADVYAWAKKENPDWTDFPALPIEVIDNETGKFITDIEYADNKLTIHRADVDWDDVQNKPDIALKSDLPTELGVMSVDAGDDTITIGGDGKDVTISVTPGIFDDFGAASAVQTGVEDGTIVAAEAGHANSADNALNADYATNAEHADFADAATHATDADNATNADIATHASSADWADSASNATRVVNALTIKVGGEDVVFDGADENIVADVDAAIAAGVAEAKKYADDNDANTEYHVEYDSTNKKIKLVAGADASKMEIDATAFIKDGMIESVELVQEDASGNKGQFLKLTWNDDGKDVTYVPVGELVDVYTGSTGATVDVAISNQNVVSASVHDIKDAHIASDAAIAKGKLAADVQNSLAKADTAAQAADLAKVATSGEYSDLTGLPTLGALAAKSIVVSTDIANEAVGTEQLGDKAVTPSKLDNTLWDEHEYVANMREASPKNKTATTIYGGDTIGRSSITIKAGGFVFTDSTGDVAEFASLDLANMKAEVGAKKAVTDLADSLGALATKDNITHDLVTDFDAAVKAIKVDDADKLDGHDADYFATAERVKALEDANHISEITTTENGGLKVTNKNQIDIDTDIVFVLNCNY